MDHQNLPENHSETQPMEGVTGPPPPYSTSPSLAEPSLSPKQPTAKLQQPIVKKELKDCVPDLHLPIQDEAEFQWTIPSYSAILNEERLLSPEFECAGHHWRLLIFPNGNKAAGTISAFLECIEASKQPQDSRWHICANFIIAVVNPTDHLQYRFLPSQHRYTTADTDWGFSILAKHSDLRTISTREGHTRPILEDDKLTFIVHLQILEDESGVLWHNFANWDSKQETGYVGLLNQGATCYLNSLLQSLYFTNYFRKATFQIPTEGDDPQKSVPLALQRLFYNMQVSNVPVGTNELTRSFGWDSMDAFYQHDVQELNRVLQDNLEEKMKGTKAEGAIQKLFTGKMKSYIKCINVDYESSRVEDYYDIQLNVKGCKDLTASFVEYCAVETLEGDNKYFAEGFGLQDAKKGCIFHEFPPVLHLQLKRFEYDMERDAMVKMNDRHEFPQVIDLDQFLEANIVRSQPQRYHLHGVLVHSGEIHAGHYCAFIRPEKGGKWFKFDDDRVIPVTKKEVFDDNFGGETAQSGGNIRLSKRFTNAYMLVYIRESDLDEILAPVEKGDIPEHLRQRFEEERIATERRQKERAEQHLYLTVKAVTDEVIRQHGGFDLVDFTDKNVPIANFRLTKDTKFAQLKTTIAEHFGYSLEHFRLWPFVARQNQTIRPDTPLAGDAFDELDLETLKSKIAKSNQSELRFYVEYNNTPLDLTQTKPSYFYYRDPNVKSGQLMVFLKFYDPFTRTVEFVSTYTAKNGTVRLSELIPLIQQMKGFTPTTKIALFEEIKPGMVDLLDAKITLTQAELGDGDIICFQRELTEQEIAGLPDPSFATVSGYFDNLFNQVSIVLKPKMGAKQHKGEYTVVMSKKMKYDAVVERIGALLEHEPLKIRLTSPNSRAPLRRLPNMHLSEMLGTVYSHADPILYYEMLNVSIVDLETKSLFKVMVMDQELKETETCEILVPKEHPTTQDVLSSLHESGKADIVSRPWRLVEVNNHSLSKILEQDEDVSRFGEYYTGMIYAEPIPEEEVHLSEKDKVVTVVHYNKDKHRKHGIPFRFVLRDGELFSETKKRLQSRIGFSEKEFNKIKVTYLPIASSEIRILEDDDIVCDLEFASVETLGLDHPEKKSSRMAGLTEKAIKIFN